MATPTLNMEETMRLMDVADALRRQNKNIRKQLTALDKENLREQLTKQYAAMGASLDPAEINQAIEEFLAGRNRFKEPATGLKTKASELYVGTYKARKRIAGISAAVAITTALTWGAVETAQGMMLRNAERRVEAKVESVALEYRTVSADIGQAGKSPLLSQLPENERITVQANLSNADNTLAPVGGFVSTYTRDGQADDIVTRRNFQAVSDAVEPQASAISSAKAILSVAQRSLHNQAELNSAKASLDSIMQEISSIESIAETTLKESRTAYQSGTSSIEQRELASAKGYVNALTGIRDNTRAFTQSRVEAESVYHRLKGIAEEDIAVKKSDELRDMAQRYITSANTQGLRSVVSEMKGLEQTLSQSYTIIITGGKWRYLNSNPNVKNFYVLVKAVSPNGTNLRMGINNEEYNGRLDQVTEWGERVTEAQYERVKDDKMDNGIIDNDKFGAKKKGFLSVERKYPDVGQITEW
jgi:hypothetical protein